jgi:hypothetical protein
LYKADGTRFNGTLTINWNSFQAADTSAVVTQSTTVKVVDGNLRVQLVPSTTASPPSTYSVTYNSDGRIQFRESWAVPSSTHPLRVRDVRVSIANSTTGPPADTTAPVQESDIVGLIADLGARPLKGTGFAAGRVALVNSSGMLDSVTGTATDCVHVDGTSGPCGDPNAPSFVDGDSPAGIVDGANATFTLTSAPSPASSLAIYRNGLLQKLTQDYAFSGRNVVFVAAAIPQPGDTLLASYRLGGGSSGSGISGALSSYPVPEVLCSGAGGATSGTTATSIGSCFIPAGMLLAGDRVELRVDVEHTGSAAGYSFEVDWGVTVAFHRDAAASEARAVGRADASIVADGAILSTQSWGNSLAFAANVSKSIDAWANGLTITFFGTANSAADSVALRNFTVVRIP